MKIPNSWSLNDYPIITNEIPTFQQVTQGQEVCLVMKDGTVGVYRNEGGFELHCKHKDWDEFYKDCGLTEEDEAHVFDESLTKEVQKTNPNVAKVLLGWL